MQFEYSQQISKIIQISNFMKIHAVGAELFHTDGRTVRYNEANSHCPDVCIKPKIPCSVPKQDQVSRLYRDLYSAA